MRLRAFLFAAALALPAGACGFNHTHYSNDPDASAIDARTVDAAAIDAVAPDAIAPDASACTESCSGTDAITCPDGASGDPVTTPCALGCSDSGPHPRCMQIVPSNGVSLDELATVTGGWTILTGEMHAIDSDSGSVDGLGVPAGLHFSIVDIAPNSYGVLAVDSLTIQNGGTLVIRGTRPLIILSRGDVAIHGVIDAAANTGNSGTCRDGTTGNWSCPGPGGGRGGIGGLDAGGCGPGANGYQSGGSHSGGGGAFAQNGGSAGPSGTGGASGTCPGPSLVPLQGGSGGGASQQIDASILWSAGGSGGGALQITSLASISLSAAGGLPGYISVAGAGGQGTQNVVYAGFTGGGAGGGAGGAVLLEAVSISIDTFGVFGGGGGGGSGAEVSAATVDGKWGQLIGAVAPGGEGQATSGGAGGDGGAFVVGSLLAPVDGHPATGAYGPGGGWGSTGRLRINVHDNALTQTNVTATTSTTIGSIAVQ